MRVICNRDGVIRDGEPVPHGTVLELSAQAVANLRELWGADQWPDAPQETHEPQQSARRRSKERE